MVILAAVGEKSDQERVIEVGYDLAQAYDDELVVLHVIPEDQADTHLEAIRTIDEFDDLSISTEIERAANIAESFVQEALGGDSMGRVSPVGRIGNPDEEILTEADALDPRFLVVGGRKRSPAGKVLFGSVTQTVILESTQPVVTVLTSLSASSSKGRKQR